MLFRVREHCAQDEHGEDRDADLRHGGHPALPHVGQPDGHLPRAALHLHLPQHLLRHVQAGRLHSDDCCTRCLIIFPSKIRKYSIDRNRFFFRRRRRKKHAIRMRKMEQQAAALVAGAVVQPNKVEDKGYVTQSFGRELLSCNHIVELEVLNLGALCILLKSVHYKYNGQSEILYD